MSQVPRGTELDIVKFHHIPHNNANFKMYELFTSGIFHLIFLDLSGLQVTETTESETTDKGEGWDTAISIYGTKETAWNETGKVLICA